MWSTARPDDAAFEDMGAFGSKTMAFEQWLRWVFVPRVEETLAKGGPFPRSSEVAVYATRELDGAPIDTGPLLAALRRFDALFG